LPAFTRAGRKGRKEIRMIKPKKAVSRNERYDAT
jgi:hypothetical protein